MAGAFLAGASIGSSSSSSSSCVSSSMNRTSASSSANSEHLRSASDTAAATSAAGARDDSNGTANGASRSSHVALDALSREKKIDKIANYSSCQVNTQSTCATPTINNNNSQHRISFHLRAISVSATDSKCTLLPAANRMEARSIPPRSPVRHVAIPKVDIHN